MHHSSTVGNQDLLLIQSLRPYALATDKNDAEHFSDPSPDKDLGARTIQHNAVKGPPNLRLRERVKNLILYGTCRVFCVNSHRSSLFIRRKHRKIKRYAYHLTTLFRNTMRCWQPAHSAYNPIPTT